MICILQNVKYLAHWKLQKFPVTFLWQKFRENNVFIKEITKELILTKYFSGERKFPVLSHCMYTYLDNKSSENIAIYFILRFCNYNSLLLRVPNS